MTQDDVNSLIAYLEDHRADDGSIAMVDIEYVDVELILTALEYFKDAYFKGNNIG